jgi:glutamate carboxypeptidase
MSTSGKERISELTALFASRQAAMLADLESLVGHESPSDASAHVSALAGWIVERLARSGTPAERVPCAGRGDAVSVRWGSDEGGTLILGHLDTVWPLGTLREIPFQVEGDVARGPGVFDMKAGLAVVLALLDAVAKGEVSPKGGLSVIFTPDEEIGSEASRAFFVEEAQRRQRVLVLEPAGDEGAVKVARKGTGLVRARFYGIASHAGLEPEKGASALLELARYALFADALADRTVGTSVVPTTATAGTKTNVVPENAELTIDFRVWTAEEGERLTAALSTYRPVDERVRLEIQGGLNRPPMEPTSVSLDIYHRAASIAGAMGFDLPIARVGGASDGNLTAAAGVPTLDGLGPSGGGAHARSERLDITDLSRRAALLSALLEDVEP